MRRFFVLGLALLVNTAYVTSAGCIGSSTLCGAHNNISRCVNETISTWVDEILSCLNGGCTEGAQDGLKGLCPGWNCTTMVFVLYGNCSTNISSQLANITLQVCIRNNTYRGSGPTTSTAEPPSAKTTTPAFYSPDKLLKLDEELGDDTESDPSDDNDVVKITKFNGTTVGTVKDPLYESPKTGNKVHSLQVDGIDDEPFFGRAVVRDKRISSDGSPLKPASLQEGDNNPSGDQAETYSGTMGDRVVMIAAYDNNKRKANIHRVSLTLNASSTTGLKEFTQLTAKDPTLATSKYVRNAELSCGFLDQHGDMSTKGCDSTQVGTNVQCLCDHTTVFAVLLSVTLVEVPKGVKITTYVTEVTSVIFLVMTGILLMKVRKHIRGDRVKVQICVTFSLLILHVLNIFHDAAANNETTCEIFTVLVHFFLLSSAMWMLMEGVTLVCKTMDTVMRYLSGRNARKFAIFRYVVSWAIPFIIVLISASVGLSNESYMPINPIYTKTLERGISVDAIDKYHHCWVGPKNSMLLGAVIIPIAVILSLCTLIVVRMSYVVFKMSSESDNYKPTAYREQSSSAIGDAMELEHVRAALKATLVLLPVLGVPWFLGFFSALENGTASSVFMYLNAIINGLQGVFLFFIYCVIGKEVRVAITKSYMRNKLSMGSSFEFSSSKPRRPSALETNAHQRSMMTSVAESENKMNGEDEANGGKLTSGV